MNRIEILQKIQIVFNRLIEDESVVLSEEMTPDDVEKWDSLFQAHIVTELENSLQMKFKLREILSWDSIGDIVTSIESHQQ